MSFYSEHEGEIKLINKKDYEEVKKYLIEGGWASEESWLDEMGSKLSSDSPFTDSLQIIEFYGSNQRNIHRFFGWFEEQNFEWKGHVVGASTDGCFEGWIIQPNEKEIHDDLDEWAEQKGLANDKPNPDDDEFLEWQYNVIESYLNNPYIEPENSVKFMTEDQPKAPEGRHPSELFKKGAI